jgi:hypothetical protein
MRSRTSTEARTLLCTAQRQSRPAFASVRGLFALEQDNTDPRKVPTDSRSMELACKGVHNVSSPVSVALAFEEAGNSSLWTSRLVELAWNGREVPSVQLSTH